MYFFKRPVAVAHLHTHKKISSYVQLICKTICQINNTTVLFFYGHKVVARDFSFPNCGRFCSPICLFFLHFSQVINLWNIMFIPYVCLHVCGVPISLVTPNVLSQVLNKIDLPGAEPDRVIKEIEEVCLST